MNDPTLSVGMTNFGFLYRTTLEESLQHIASAGYREVEIAAVPPHISVADMDSTQIKSLSRTLDALELTCVSINPVEMNLISAYPQVREHCRQQYLGALRVLAGLGGDVVMVVPGRQNGLIPMPEADAKGLLCDHLEALLAEASTLGVSLALETTPFGFYGSTSSLVELVDEFSDDHLGIAIDVANIFPNESIAESVRLAGPRLKMAQFSGSWRDRWAHASVQEGDIDFDELRVALDEQDYSGPCIYELVDGADPIPRIGPDLLALEAAGWSR